MIRSIVYAMAFAVVAAVQPIQLTASNLSTRGSQAEDFLQSVKASDYSYRYLQLGIQSLRAIEFDSKKITKYIVGAQRMTVDSELNDGSNHLKRVENLSAIQLGTLAHESFHAFKEVYLDRNLEYAGWKSWMEARATSIFSDLPSRKAKVALEEAYAVFIGNMVTAKANGNKMLTKRKADANCAGLSKLVENNWIIAWNEKVPGYYFKDGIGSRLGQGIGDVLTSIFKDEDANNERLRKDPALFSKNILEDTDKTWIVEHVLDKKISQNPARTYEVHMEQFNCP